MATSFIATGADVVSNAQTSFNTTGPGQDGDLRLTGGNQPFPDDYIIEFFVTGEDSDGELVNGAGYTGFKVYASTDDFNNGVVLHDYTPQNPGQTGTIQTDGSGSGDCYTSFNNVFLGDNGAPSLSGRIFIAPGSNAANQIGSFETRRFEDIDFNGDGDTTDPGESGNGLFNVNKPDAQTMPCFAAGTRIATIRGEIAVERLQAGDQIITRDNGIQTIRWAGSCSLSAVDMALDPTLTPIHIAAGALGKTLPETDLVVSPNHRMLLCDPQAALYFDENEVLIAAKHLVGRPGITRARRATVTYVHIMFDQHEIVLANGAWSESFLPGDFIMSQQDSQTQAEILRLFPELAGADTLAGYATARRALRGHEARLLMNSTDQAA